MAQGLEWLAVTRVNRVMEALQDVRDLPQELVFLNRAAVTPAADGEIMARYIGRAQIADIVANDAKAVTYSTGKFSIESNSSPNIKHGRDLSQEEINWVLQLDQEGRIPGGGYWQDVEAKIVADLKLGIDQRREALMIAMHLDSVTYDRLGMKISGSWGMPSDLKVTPATDWSNAASATPVNDVLGLQLVARTRYGVSYDRMTMSTAAFRLMIATTEFQNKARMYLAPNVSYVNIPLADIAFNKNLATNILQLKEIVLYDGRYWSQDPATGQQTSSPFLPLNQVILDSTANDKNSQVQDFANGVVTESVLSSLAPVSMVGRFGAPARGPVCYATVPPDLNPPNITYWGVCKGFPRKFKFQASALITLNTITDPIAVTEVF